MHVCMYTYIHTCSLRKSSISIRRSERSLGEGGGRRVRGEGSGVTEGALCEAHETHVNMYVCMCACVSVCMHVCMYACMNTSSEPTKR